MAGALTHELTLRRSLRESARQLGERNLNLKAHWQDSTRSPYLLESSSAASRLAIRAFDAGCVAVSALSSHSESALAPVDPVAARSAASLTYCDVGTRAGLKSEASNSITARSCVNSRNPHSPR